MLKIGTLKCWLSFCSTSSSPTSYLRSNYPIKFYIIFIFISLQLGNVLFSTIYSTFDACPLGHFEMWLLTVVNFRFKLGPFQHTVHICWFNISLRFLEMWTKNSFRWIWIIIKKILKKNVKLSGGGGGWRKWIRSFVTCSGTCLYLLGLVWTL